MVMLESLHTHFPQAHVHVLCLSEQCYAALTALAYPYVSLIRLIDLEAADPDLVTARADRTLVEYYFTITPCLPWYLLTHNEAIQEITYLDADMMFFSSPEPLFAEAEGASIIITPHRFDNHLAPLAKYGIYNVSWMTFRRTLDGMACLDWYRRACLDWCKDELQADRFADQKYLDIFPQKFSGVHVIRHWGGGCAPWNLTDTLVDQKNDIALVNRVPLIFYHAQGFRHIRGPFYSSGMLNYDCKPNRQVKKYILMPYAVRYAEASETARHLINAGSFAGIRQETKKTQAFLSACKNILREWKQHSLVFCWP